MTNCYFCHRPVFDQDVQISVRAPLINRNPVRWTETDRNGIEHAMTFALVEHYAHPDCLQSAARNSHPQEKHAQATA